MNITATKVNGKHYTRVVSNGRIVFRSPGYVTARMAMADARCWIAFHGEAKPMITYRPVTASFTYYTPVTDGSTTQRQYASIDAEVPEGMSNHDIAMRAWKLLTRNWDNPGTFLVAKVSR